LISLNAIGSKKKDLTTMSDIDIVVDSEDHSGSLNLLQAVPVDVQNHFRIVSSKQLNVYLVPLDA
jgi:hypothetical protein